MNSFPAKARRSITLDLQSLAKASIPAYTKYGFMTFLRFANDKKLPLSVKSFKEFSLELQEKGKSHTQITSAFGGFKIVCAAFDIPIQYQDFMAYKNRIRAHSRAFAARNTKKWRYPISVSDMELLLDNPPRGCKRSSWNNFVTLAWVFLLRKEEITRVVPTDLQRKFDEKGKYLGWSLRVANNKNSQNKREGKFIYFPKDHIPEVFHCILDSILEHKGPLFPGLPNSKIIIEHLRSVISIDECTYVLVIHSFRHGRPEHLTTVHKYSDQQLMKVGRWDSIGGRKVYQHS